MPEIHRAVMDASRTIRFGGGVTQLLLRLLATIASGALIQAAPALNQAPVYEFRPAHPDGIGKFYCGREIAQVMGHTGADWLERPERLQEEEPDHLIEALDFRPGEQVGDLGAGTGYFTRRIAAKVGPEGCVYAVDVQPEMLVLLSNRLAALRLRNVKPILGTVRDPKLPDAALDTILLVDVYHELAFPYEMGQAICRALKPGGRLVLVEYRAEDPEVPIKPLHKMSEVQVRREIALLPLQWERTIGRLPRQHILIFRKPKAALFSPQIQGNH